MSWTAFLMSLGLGGLWLYLAYKLSQLLQSLSSKGKGKGQGKGDGDGDGDGESAADKAAREQRGERVIPLRSSVQRRRPRQRRLQHRVEVGKRPWRFLFVRAHRESVRWSRCVYLTGPLACIQEANLAKRREKRNWRSGPHLRASARRSSRPSRSL